MINLTDKIKQAIREIGNDRGLIKNVLKEATDMIKIRTSRGIGVNRMGGIEGGFLPLEESTIKARKRKNLAPGVGPAKSRLTETGQMVDSISYRVQHKEGTIFFKGGRRDSELTNEELAVIHNEGKGRVPKRPFFYLSAKEIKKLTNLVRREIKEKLKSIL